MLKLIEQEHFCQRCFGIIFNIQSKVKMNVRKHANYIYYKTQMQSQKHLTPLKRRLHTHSEDNIRITQRLSMVPKRARLNTIQNEEDLINEKLTLVKSPSKGILSPIKFYESRLNISSESWSVLSFRENKYKRGWRPIKTVVYSSFLRILMMRIYYDLRKKYPIIDRIWVKTNTYLLSSEEKIRSLPISQQLKLKQLRKKQPSHLKLAQNTFILLKDLIAANLYENRQQINEYVIIFLGSLLLDIQKGGTPKEDRIYSFQEPAEQQIIIEQAHQAIKYTIQYINAYLKDENYTSCTVSQKCQLQSSPYDITRIFADFIRRYPDFLKLISKKQMAIVIKYQMGYRFYEERKIKFVQEWINFQNHIMLKYRGNVNFEVISFNKQTQNIFTLYDCKYGMEESDLRRIEQFLLVMAKPIVVKKGTPVRLLPILKIAE